MEITELMMQLPQRMGRGAPTATQACMTCVGKKAHLARGLIATRQTNACAPLNDVSVM